MVKDLKGAAMSEIYIEGRFKMPVVNTDEFGYDEEEVKKFDWEDFAKDEFWNSCDYMGELEDKYDITFHKVQPQLTIPKSIADEIDCVVNPIGQIVLKSGILSDFTVEAISWIYKNNENGYIAIAYANPLTRDLVKVVEG